MTNEEWMMLLRLGGAAGGMAGGMGAFGGAAGAVPTGDTLSGADALTAGAIQPPAPPPDFGAGVPGQALQPGMEQGGIGSDMERAGILPTQGPPPPPALKTNLGLPAQTPLTPAAVDATTASAPLPPGAAGAAPYPFKYADKPIGTENTRTWWERNVSDPWDKANTTDPKTGLSPAQKALAAMGTSAGGAATKAATPTAPALSGGAGAYKPTPINAAQMALTREQQLELLRKRARTSMPWLNRLQQSQQGLMG